MGRSQNLRVMPWVKVFIKLFRPGHPYVDIIDNKMDFESKINRLISCVAAKMGIDIGDRLNVNAKKVKFAVTGPLPKDSAFPNFRDFEVRERGLRWVFHDPTDFRWSTITCRQLAGRCRAG